MNEVEPMRHELKLTCPAHHLEQARAWIRLHPAGFRSTFPTRQVNSLYLDTHDLHSFHENLDGQSNRQKVRLRWYGLHTSLIDRPILELKVKDNLLGGKKQQVLNCSIDWEQPYAKILRSIQQAADDEWGPALAVATQPTLINSYMRDYFAAPNSNIRVTLDYQQVAYGQRMALRPNFTRPLMGQDMVIIEVKGAAEEVQALEEIMHHFPIRRGRNSKYVNGMQAQWF